MKIIRIILLLIAPFGAQAQSWFPMGNIDTVGNTNGNKIISGIYYYNNKITVGGNFKKENATILNGIAQWDGYQWQPMSAGVWWGDGAVIDSVGNGGGAFMEYKNKFYSAGVFIGAGGNINNPLHLASNISNWDGVDWFPLSQPSSGVNSTCTSLSVYHNNLYLGGWFGASFDSFGSHSTESISKWNDTVFSAVGQLAGDFLPYYDDAVIDLTVFQNKLIVGGYFTSINGSSYGTYSGIASWDDTSWGALGAGFNDAVWALTVFNGELYAGGQFTATRDNVTSLNHIAKWNGTNWQAVGEGLNDTIITLCVDSLQNKLYAGGAFTQTGLGIPAKHIAQWTGTNWQELGGGTNRTVAVLFAKDSNLYAGGEFTRAGNVQTSLIARWGYNTTVGVGEIEKEEPYIFCYPNPASSVVNFSYTLPNSSTQAIIRIYDNIGKLIKNITTEKTQGIETYNTEQLSNGLYYYTLIVSNTTIASGKFVINK